MVNRPNQVYFEREGIIYLSRVAFRDDNHIMRIIEKIIAPLGRRVDESSPMVDARLTGRLARQRASSRRWRWTARPSPSASSRATPSRWTTCCASAPSRKGMVDFLHAAVPVRQNIIISGGTGTGKTTLLNVLSSFIPDRERLVTVEDPCELQLRQPHVVRLETRPPNIEGKGEVVQRQLVRNALRMRPDRIIVGEVRAGEAFDMLQAMNTGHDGSLTTVHANTPARRAQPHGEHGADGRLRTAGAGHSRAGGLGASTSIVHLSRFRDGTRKVTQVTEIAGMEGETITLQDLFLFHQTGVDAGGQGAGRAGGDRAAPALRRALRAGGHRPAGRDCSRCRREATTRWS